MAGIVDRKGFAFGVKWIAAGAVAIAVGVGSYFDKSLSQIGIGWKLILAGGIMLPIGIAIAVGACREPAPELPEGEAASTGATPGQ
jgi:hypothetical protein